MIKQPILFFLRLTFFSAPVFSADTASTAALHGQPHTAHSEAPAASVAPHTVHTPPDAAADRRCPQKGQNKAAEGTAPPQWGHWISDIFFFRLSPDKNTKLHAITRQVIFFLINIFCNPHSVSCHTTAKPFVFRHYCLLSFKAGRCRCDLIFTFRGQASGAAPQSLRQARGMTFTPSGRV